MSTTTSKAEFAALCNVAPSRVSHWIKDGALSGPAIVGTGRKARINVNAAQAQLRAKLDVGQSHGNGRRRLDAVGRSTLGAAQTEPASACDLPAYACVKTLESLGDMKAVLLGLRLVYGIGATASNLALAAGAPMKVAFAMKDLATIAFIEQLEEALAWLDIPTDQITYARQSFDDLDWKQRAADVGEPFDLKAWKAWAAERKASINAGA